MWDLPPDPLLTSDSFIKAHITGEEETPPYDTDTITYQDHDGQSTPEPVQVYETFEKNGGELEIGAGNVGGVDFESPDPVSSGFSVKAPTKRGRRKKSDFVGNTASVSTETPPDWLPSGWYVEDRVRASGASAGHVDKYYCDPASGHKFRSKLEVIRFQETGNKRQRLPVKKTSNGVKLLGSSSSSSNRRKWKTGSRAKNPVSKFDFANVPDKVGWVLTDSSTDSWTPFEGDTMIHESSKEEWSATFTALATRKVS